jgi:hypothetical protein
LKQKTLSLILLLTLIASTMVVFTGSLNTVKAAVPSTTTISASATNICANNTVTLTVSVTGSTSPVPSGTVIWSSNSTTGVFSSNSTLNSSGTATTTFVDTSPSNVSITASYSGDSNNLPSSQTTTLTIRYAVDFNHDGRTDFKDLVAFVSSYINYNLGKAYDSQCDLNHDGKLNFNDIKLLRDFYVAWGH